MSPPAPLPHGVRMTAAGEGWVLRSPSLPLPLDPPRGRVPGTAVLWQEQLLEVRERVAEDSGQTWRLVLFPDGLAARRFFTLDAAAIEALAAARLEAARRARARRRLTLALPIAGLAPGWLQERWEREAGFPVGPALWASALLQAPAGGVGTVQLMAAALAGQWFLPVWLRWLAPLGPFLLLDTLLRVTVWLSQGRPIGSFFALPLWLWAPRAARPAPPEAPPFRFVRTTFRTALYSLAPTDYQWDWAVATRGSPTVLTGLAGLAELAGGLANLLAGSGGHWRLLDLLFVVEGATRLGAAAVLGRPLGSLLGLALVPVYRRWRQ